jgi:pimeloyl-ACP methyl ester carboxylesterase
MTANSGGFIRANGIDIYYVQAGQGMPLILLHGGLVSTNPIWAPTPVSYAGHMETLARRYRVIAPDTRGCGRTVHDGGVVTFDQLADDVLALADALDLGQPLIAGFSEGGSGGSAPGQDPTRRWPGPSRRLSEDWPGDQARSAIATGMLEPGSCRIARG